MSRVRNWPSQITWAIFSLLLALHSLQQVHLKMFRNTFQSGFLSVLYSVGYVFLSLRLFSIAIFAFSKLIYFPKGANHWRSGILKVHKFTVETLYLYLFTPFLVKNGHIKRLTDEDIQSSVLELAGTNVSTTFISCPADPKKTLAIKLPFLVMIIKNVRLWNFDLFLSEITSFCEQMKKYFTFEVQVLDDKGIKRRFRASNYQVCGSQYP